MIILNFILTTAEQMKIDGLDVILEQCECQIFACYPRSNADDLFGFAWGIPSLFLFLLLLRCECFVCRIVEYLLDASNENDNDNGNNTG